MRRGDVYRVKHPTATDPRRQRAFVVVSRQALIDSSFSTVVCAPVYSRRDGLATQVDVGIDQGLKYESSVHCDELVSLLKSQLTDYGLTAAQQACRARSGAGRSARPWP